ncbi:TetR/AcrR family transcriptional regulator [Williamsia maris]|uniref:TetR/AcrR family transcriptional regulator n=1 Tax=Williamsia maris TaxID=72806 RepID=UPI0020A54765|nr:TetR/AcrR family transcriptional regulator [Williamsia maris]
MASTTIDGDGGVAVTEADPAPRLTRSAIVDVAIELADAEGFAAVSMRKLADRLGVGAMSLYRHVADKDALLMAMTEEVGRRFPYPHEMAPVDAAGDGSPIGGAGDDLDVVGHRSWRECVQVAVEIDWALYQRHPWVVLAYSSPRHSMGASSLGCLDWMMAGFGQLGVDRVTAAEMTLTLWSYIQGVALADVSEQLLRTNAEHASTRSGLDDVLDGEEADPPPPRVAALRGVGRERGLTDSRRRLDHGVDLLCVGFEAAAAELGHKPHR